MHFSTPNMFPYLTLKETLYLKFRNGGIPSDPHFSNTYQQTTYGLHKNHSKRLTITYHSLLSQIKIIQIKTQQNKTIRYFENPSYFTSSKIQPFIRQQNQNKFSKLSLKWIFKPDLIFLWLFYFTLVINLEEFVPDHKTL